MMTMTQERFISLWRKYIRDDVKAAPGPIYEDLFRRYSEPHRRYHTPRHIDRCLKQLDLARNLMDDPDAVEMALWFHDVIYDPGENDNELKSAEWFTSIARHSLDPTFARKVHDLILVTMHRTPPNSADERFLVDVDLSSFGLPWEEFRRDSEAVREEFKFLPDEQFYPGQIRFLKSLLRRQTLYSTDLFQERYEETAQENIKRYMDELYGRGFTDEDVEQTILRPRL